MTHQLILASSSFFRKQLLNRLGLTFSVISPEVDETALPGEAPWELAKRLAQTKANAVLESLPANTPALIIGSDQVAVLDNRILGKPGHHEKAADQLRQQSGRNVIFYTALCVLNSSTRHMQIDLVDSKVLFRQLTEENIAVYLEREPAYNCAGSFKSEGLGIALLENIVSNDPTALIGLPLISLAKMLEREGLNIL